MSNPASPISLLLNDTALLQTALSSPAAILSLVEKEANAIADPPAATNLWPIKCGAQADRLLLAGVPAIEKAAHASLEQGRMLEKGIGSANAALSSKMLDVNEKIQQYLKLNTLATDGQLPDVPRAAKYAKDSLKIITQVNAYLKETVAIAAALQANLALLQAVKGQMTSLIQNNITALVNLLHQICNWGLPELPSLAARLGGGWHWDGFRFNAIAGFNFNPLLTVPNFSFSFAACVPLSGSASAAFGSPVSTLSDSTLTVRRATPLLALAGASFADPSTLTAAEAAALGSTSTPVFDPSLVTSTNGLSLPTPISIVSNYALAPATYAQNIVSAVPALQPIVIQPGDPDFGSTASLSRQSAMRGLLIRYVTLLGIVESNFDPNLTAAWLFSLGLNRSGRGGAWLPNFEAVYAEHIQPSLAYLNTTPVPWNEVFGGSGVHAGPSAIPLIADLRSADADNLLWRLSFVEASLLGYPRSTAWDAAADLALLSFPTGADLDWVPTTVAATPTATTILGAGTALYPVSATYPQSIAGVLSAVIAMAAGRISASPLFQSSRPQFRFAYDMFAQATLVDRYTQFWREFHANLVALLADDPYLVDFAVTYPAVLDSAIDPLGDHLVFTQLTDDATARNRRWTPGSVLLPIPSATVLASASSVATDLSNGWTGGSLDAEAYLSRPDIQAQTLPVQYAMLRTNQSFASLMTTQSNLNAAIDQATSTANAAIATAGAPGWQVESSAAEAIPPGATGANLQFPKIDFDQTGFVEDSATIGIPTTGAYLLSVSASWDPTGASGARSLTLLRNTVAVATGTSIATSSDPFSVAIATELTLSGGDQITVIASHSLRSAQTVLAGATFLGLVTDPTAVDAAAASTSTSSSSLTSTATTTPFVAGSAFPAYTALAQGSDGNVVPINPGSLVVGVVPFADGIAMASASGPGITVPVATAYGQTFAAPGQNWSVGGLLYVASDGSLTQDFPTLAATTHWIVCVGKAVTSSSFLFQPHLPTNYTQNW